MKNVKHLAFPFIFMLFMGFILSSCGEQNLSEDPVILYESQDAVMTYQAVGKEIEFFLDILGDTSESTGGSFPATDFANLYVDVNNNGRINAMFDLTISNLEDGRLCYSYFIDSTNSITPCEFDERAIVERRFSTTDNSEERHVNYRFLLPKKLIALNSEIKVVIRVFDPQTGYRYFPGDWALFSKAYEIMW